MCARLFAEKHEHVIFGACTFDSYVFYLSGIKSRKLSHRNRRETHGPASAGLRKALPPPPRGWYMGNRSATEFMKPNAYMQVPGTFGIACF